VVGDVLAYRGIIFAPVNEMGVVMLFAAAAHELGFVVESSGIVFPDCIVWRRIAPGRWKRLRAEIEYRSTNFRVHRHDPKRCQLVVCWEHDWLRCPVEVYDLKAELAKLRGE
jgi:hypothetical protein